MHSLADMGTGIACVVRVFVSSPIDVRPERGRVQAVAAKLNRFYQGLVRFETLLWEERFYKADKSFQPQIVEPAACDIVISIFWTRIGTEQPADFPRMPDGRAYPSGTAYELLTALEASKSKGVPDVYVFRKTADARIATTDAERRRQAQTQLDALEAFWSEWFKSEKGQYKAAFQTFASTDEFEREVEKLLRQWLEDHDLLGPAPAIGRIQSYEPLLARSLIVSHWSVGDEATARLMIGTFRASARDPKLSHAEALRESMLLGKPKPFKEGVLALPGSRNPSDVYLIRQARRGANDILTLRGVNAVLNRGCLVC
jgi:hypothetical protein